MALECGWIVHIPTFQNLIKDDLALPDEHFKRFPFRSGNKKRNSFADLPPPEVRVNRLELYEREKFYTFIEKNDEYKGPILRPCILRRLEKKENEEKRKPDIVFNKNKKKNKKEKNNAKKEIDVNILGKKLHPLMTILIHPKSNELVEQRDEQIPEQKPKSAIQREQRNQVNLKVAILKLPELYPILTKNYIPKRKIQSATLYYSKKKP